MNPENWLPVVGWEGFYDVSGWGRVRSLTRVVVTGRGPRVYQGRILKQDISTNGYPAVTLSRVGIQVRRMVHHLVLEAYVGPCPEGQEALHGTAGKLDASVGNLRWGTRSENICDRTRDGQDNRGERQGAHKLTAVQVAEIRERWAGGAGARQSDLAAEFGVTRSNIWLIVHDKNWHYPETDK